VLVSSAIARSSSQLGNLQFGILVASASGNYVRAIGNSITHRNSNLPLQIELSQGACSVWAELITGAEFHRLTAAIWVWRLPLAHIG